MAKQHLGIRIESELMDKLKELADIEQRSLSNYLSIVLNKHTEMADLKNRRTKTK